MKRDWRQGEHLGGERHLYGRWQMPERRHWPWRQREREGSRRSSGGTHKLLTEPFDEGVEGWCRCFCLSRWQNGSVNYQAEKPGEGARSRGIRDNTHFNLRYFEIHKYVSHPGDQLKTGDLVSKESFWFEANQGAVSHQGWFWGHITGNETLVRLTRD